MKIYLREIKERFPEFEIRNYDENAYFVGFNHDSRAIEQNELFNIKVQEKKQVRLAKEQAKAEAKASALVKLTALGLTEEEVKSIL